MAAPPERAQRQQYLALLLAKFVRDGLEDLHPRGDLQEILKAQGKTRGVHGRNGHPEAVLKRLLTCGHCGKAMIHAVTRKRDGTRYRYYACTTAQKEGVDACPTRTTPAAELEDFVIAQITRIATQPTMIAEVVQQEHLQERQRA